MSALMADEAAYEVPPRPPVRQRLPFEPADAALDRAALLVRNGHVVDALALADVVWPEVEACDDALLMGLCEHVRAACQQYLGNLEQSLVAGYKAIALLERAEAPQRLLRSISLQATTIARVGSRCCSPAK